MISNSDEDIVGWSNDGEMLVVKDTAKFASEVIPQYFDHCKFSSFARQLNFYGFRKVQDRPIRNADIDSSTAKHVKFCNDDFKRGQPELLHNIQRSTKRGGNAVNSQEQQRQINQLKEQVASYEKLLSQLTAKIGSMEQIFTNLTKQLSHNQGDPDSNRGGKIKGLERQFSAVSIQTLKHFSGSASPLECDPIPITDILVSDFSLPSQSKFTKPSLPPHPKIKTEFPPTVGQVSPSSSRQLSSASFLRGLSNDSNVLDSSSDLFRTLMLDENKSQRNISVQNFEGFQRH